MSFRSKLPLSALALACIAPLAAAAPAPDESTQAVKEFRAEVGQRLATLRGELDALDAGFKTDLDALNDDVKNLVVTPLDAHVTAFERVNTLDTDVATRLRTFTDGLETDASAHLVDLLEFPRDFVVGRRGVIDDAVRRGIVARTRATGRNHNRLRAFVARLEGTPRYDIVVDRRGQRLEPITPSRTPFEAEPPFARLRIDLLVSGSHRDAPDDGRLCLAGTADVNNGATVDVSIALPGETALTALAAEVDPETRRWRVCFPATGPGDLPEGNYSITVTQGSVSISDSLGVP